MNEDHLAVGDLVVLNQAGRNQFEGVSTFASVPVPAAVTEVKKHTSGEINGYYIEGLKTLDSRGYLVFRNELDRYNGEEVVP